MRRLRGPPSYSTALVLVWLGGMGCSALGAERCAPSAAIHPEPEETSSLSPPTPVVVRSEPRTATTTLPRTVRRLALGAQHSCFLDDTGHVHCWGGNRFGQLGTDAPERSPTSFRASSERVPALDDVVQVTAGSFHTCALRGDGSVFCFGHGGFGQLGEGRGDRSSPHRIPELDEVVEIGAGETFTCARRRDGRVICFGGNDLGELGVDDGSGPDHRTPVPDVDNVRSLAVGRHHACALRSDGRVWCWGMNAERQCGKGRATTRHPASSRPSEIPLPGVARSIAAGGAHTCAVLESGRAICWGSNDSGQLGSGDAAADASSGRAMIGLRMTLGISGALALGGRFTCARDEAGFVSCAGFNGFGQLGDGSTLPRREFVRALLGSPVRDVAAGARHACAWLSEGVHCWGKNDRGQLGDPRALDQPRPTVAMEL